MEEISKRQIEELKHLNQLKDDCLSTVSHGLRSPITNIKMVAWMLKLLLQQDQTNEDGKTQFGVNLKQIKLKAKVDHYLLIVEQECDREMNLLNNFLDLQQLDAGNYRLSQTSVDLKKHPTSNQAFSKLWHSSTANAEIKNCK